MEKLVRNLQETVNRLSNHIVELMVKNDQLCKENQDLKDKIDKIQRENVRLTTNESIRKVALEVEKEMRLKNK